MNRSPVRVRLSAQKKACKYLTYRLSSYPHTTKNRLSSKTCSHSEQSCTPATALFSTEDFRILYPRPTCYHEQTYGRFMLSPSAFFLSLGSIHTRTFATSVHLPCPASISQKKQTGNTNLRTPHHHGRDASHRHPSNSIRNLQTGRHTSPGSIATVRTTSHIRKNIGISKKCILTNPNVWAKMDSNHRRRTPADLQSAPFGHSGICPPCL
ncbi:unknown [Prevotella sp. CAG:755]|nr:unknown [Prevotella sp. CAG:755]